MVQPDLRIKEDALSFLNYYKPEVSNINNYEMVNEEFQRLLMEVWNLIPSGPGKTRFIHALNRARMEANSCIANEGA